MFYSKLFTKKNKDRDVADYAYGSHQEEVTKSHIENYLGYGIESCDRYSIFDYKSAHSFIELKSRRIESNKYHEALIGLNKIQWIRNFIKSHPNEVYRFYFFFNYIDELRVIQYDEKKFNEFKIREISRCDRPDESSEIVLIPIALTEPVVIYSERLGQYF